MSGERYYRSQSLNAQWEDLSQSIGQLLVDNERSDQVNKPEVGHVAEHVERPEITTKHWVESSRRTHCTSRECARKFTITERKHHCRRCGEVFCGKCSQYRRRLSVSASPHPEGVPYRVCKKCYDVGPQTLGCSQSHLNDFKHLRERKKSVNNNKNNLIPRKTLNYEEECQRLVDGFGNKVSSSRIMNFVRETFGAVKVPEWQKSKYWIEKSEKCLLCYKTFSMAELQSHCRICGKVICSTCSSETLIVYVEESSKSVNWCLTDIIGCPDKEPAVCLYLRICNQCHGEVAEIQGTKAMMVGQTEIDGVSVVEEMAAINQSLVDIQGNLIRLLPMYEQLVDAVEAKGDLKGLLPQGGSATQALAKYHLDLSDLFTKFAVVMQSLKKLRPRTNTQIKIAKNLTSSKFCFYNDNFSVYREIKKRLEQVLPHEVLEGVQKIVDEQAINSAYIVVKQLGLEAVLLSSSEKINDQVAATLVKCEEVCKDELQKQLEASNHDQDEHLETVNNLLQIQLKNHRLVKPSRRLSKAHGVKYVEWFLLDRSSLLLSQIIRQLNGKTSEKKFKSSKKALEEAKLQIVKLRDQK